MKDEIIEEVDERWDSYWEWIS